MAVTFGLADADDQALLEQAISVWHPDLHANSVRVGIIFAAADDDGPAVRHHGYAALATIRVVPTKDRLTKGYDAEMLVDRDHWLKGKEPHRLALLDHELSHLEVKRRKVKQPKGYKGPPAYAVVLDDLGRPKLKLRKGDWNTGDGFAAVVARHGDYATEFEDLRRAFAMAQAAKDGGAEGAA